MIIITSLLPAYSATPPKPGSVCSKQGFSKTYQGRKFTCIKSGKKLFWNRGVAVKKSEPNPLVSTSPTPSPAPTSNQADNPTPITSPTPNPVVSPSASATIPPRPTGNLTLDSLDPYWIPIIAMEKVNDYLKLQQKVSNFGKFVVSPKTPKDSVQQERLLLDKSVALWSKYFLNEKVTIVMFTNEEGDWADEALIRNGGNFPGKVSDEVKKQSQFNCNFGFATLAEQGTRPIYYMCTDLRGRRDVERHNTPHEYFHLVQQKLVWSKGFQEFPVWLHEGSATFFGTAVGFFPEDKDATMSLRFFQELYWSYDPENTGTRDPQRLVNVLKNLTEEQAVKLFEPLEKTQKDGYPSQLFAHYALGALATEVLVAVYGFETYMEFLNDFSNYGNWRQNFENRFGIKVENFYKRLTPYLKAKAILIRN